jgi:hypothetical protein
VWSWSLAACRDFFFKQLRFGGKGPIFLISMVKLISMGVIVHVISRIISHPEILGLMNNGGPGAVV